MGNETRDMGGWVPDPDAVEQPGEIGGNQGGGFPSSFTGGFQNPGGQQALQGPPGPPPKLVAGTITTLPPGQPASASLDDLGGGVYRLNLSLPQGSAGTPGEPGAPGEDGEDGADGLPATLVGGTITTLPAGSAATASLTPLGGNSYALNLGLPKGEDGAGGASSWADITGKPTTFPPSSHTHTVSDITDIAANYLALAGGTLTGKLITRASTAAAPGAGLNIPLGVAPTAPVHGDIWTLSGTVQIRLGTGTYTLAMTNSAMGWTAKQTWMASVTGNASFRIPAGVAPTTPQHGDFWTTTGELAVHINGSTYNSAWKNVDNAFTTQQTFMASQTGAPSIRITPGVAPTSPLDGSLWTTAAGGLFYRFGSSSKEIAFTDELLPEAPNDGQPYVRQSLGWAVAAAGAIISDAPPGTAQAGQFWWESDTGMLYIRYSGVWVATGINSNAAFVVLQDAAPTSPVHGMLWVNTTTFAMAAYYNDGNTAQWVQLTAGNVAPPFRGAIVKRTVAQSIPNSTINWLTFTAEDMDTDNIWSSGHLFTVPPNVTLMEFNLGVQWGNNAVGQRYVYLALGGTTTAVDGTMASRAPASTFSEHGFNTGQIQVTPGQTLNFCGFQTSGGALDVVARVTARVVQ